MLYDEEINIKSLLETCVDRKRISFDMNLTWD